MFKAAVLTVSDGCSKGEREDKSGKVVSGLLKSYRADVIAYDVVADDAESIKEKLIYYCDILAADFIFTVGGTGFGPRDVTPEATIAVSEKNAPGISELIRSEGLKNTKNSVLSRGVSVIRKRSVIVNLPGSPKGAEESFRAVSDLIPHALKMLGGSGHD